MRIDNVCRASPVFRKVHVEYARQHTMDMEIVHSVAFPHTVFDLPILGVDLVVVKGRPSMAILDFSPMPPPSCDGDGDGDGDGGGDGDGESQRVHRAFRSLKSLHPLVTEASRREVPAWGRPIFSSECVFVQHPTVHLFAEFAMDALAMYAHHAARSRPETSADRQKVIRAAHRKYCVHQLQNQRTLAVLAAAFGGDLARAYMRDVMFDADPVGEV